MLTPTNELEQVRHHYKVAYERAKENTDLMTESVIFVKPVNNGEYTVKLTVLFAPQTMPLPANSPKRAMPEVILAPTFTLHDWPLHKMAGDATELDVLTVEEAYDAAMSKLESYSTGGKYKRFVAAASQQTQPANDAPDILTTFGGDDTTGDNDPDAPLPPKSQKTIRHLRMMDHLQYLCEQSKGNWIKLDRSDAARIPHLFGLPRGGTTKGAGPDTTVEAHGYRLERKAHVGSGSRSYSYEYRLTQISDTPVPTPEATVVSVTPVPAPQYLSKPQPPRSGRKPVTTTVMEDAQPAATAATAATQQQQQPTQPITSLDAALDAVKQAVKQMEDSFDARLRAEIVKVQQATDSFYKEQQAEADEAHNRIVAKLNSQIDALNAKLDKQRKQLTALLDD